MIRIHRSIVILIAAIGTVLAVGVFVALAARQSPARYPANSPQGTVATYLALLQDGHVDRAYMLLSLNAAANDGPPLSLLDFHQQYDSWGETAHRVTLMRVDANGDTASVTVAIDTFSGGAFGASDQSVVRTFTLEHLSGTWLITGPEYF